MKYFQMIGLMNSEMFGKFVDFVNHNKDDDWSIVLNTCGGGFFVTEVIAKMVNEHSKDVEIVIQGAYSSGMMFLDMVSKKCSLLLSKTCRGMWHYGKWEVAVSDKNTPYYYEDECIIRNMPFHKRQTESFAKKIMTPKEFKDFKADKDVYFDFKRMRQIFSDAGIMK